jgi:hypothetical protein
VSVRLYVLIDGGLALTESTETGGTVSITYDSQHAFIWLLANSLIAGLLSLKDIGQNVSEFT